MKYNNEELFIDEYLITMILTSINHLHGNTTEKEEIELEEADHDLVPLIHC